MIINYCFNFISFILYSLNTKKFLHIFQLKDYSLKRYFKFFKFKFFILFFSSFLLLLSSIVLKIFQIKIITFLVVTFLTNLYILFIIKNTKTPLVKTRRITNLNAIVLCLLFIIAWIPFSFVFYPIFIFISPAIANTLNFHDKNKNKNFIHSAQCKLKSQNTKVIAITGSNGKTSVKNILLSLLNTKYKTQATPASFNTPLGISKFINEELKSDTQFLILEYGARNKNDVQDLCNLFGADYGIITNINPQHLETFKSIENIKYAKSRLSVYLKNKLCIFNIDNELCKEIYNKKDSAKVAISTNSIAYLSAQNINIKNGNTEFDLVYKKEKFHTKTLLLGNHNVANILLASALAIELNIPLSSILNTIENLKPTPHRLELIKTHINILDDSYNCSISSATEAIKTLMNFTGKKMIATPGIVECGKNQYSLNFKLGTICSCADFVIVVGKTNKNAILDGLKSQNFNYQNIFTCKTLEESKKYFSLLHTNDTLLLLNDLPDDYH